MLSDTLSQERAAASASAAAAAAAAATLQAQIEDLKAQVHFMQLPVTTHGVAVVARSIMRPCVRVLFDTRQVARAPSAQEMAALQLQLQLNAAGVRSIDVLQDAQRIGEV